jgi:hypothetical protein
MAHAHNVPAPSEWDSTIARPVREIDDIGLTTEARTRFEQRRVLYERFLGNCVLYQEIEIALRRIEQIGILIHRIGFQIRESRDATLTAMLQRDMRYWRDARRRMLNWIGSVTPDGGSFDVDDYTVIESGIYHDDDRHIIVTHTGVDQFTITEFGQPEQVLDEEDTAELIDRCDFLPRTHPSGLPSALFLGPILPIPGRLTLDAVLQHLNVRFLLAQYPDDKVFRQFLVWLITLAAGEHTYSRDRLFNMAGLFGAPPNNEEFIVLVEDSIRQMLEVGTPERARMLAILNYRDTFNVWRIHRATLFDAAAFSMRNNPFNPDAGFQYGRFERAHRDTKARFPFCS